MNDDTSYEDAEDLSQILTVAGITNNDAIYASAAPISSDEILDRLDTMEKRVAHLESALMNSHIKDLGDI